MLVAISDSAPHEETLPILIQRSIAMAALVIAGPLIVVLAIAVRLTSPGAVLPRAARR